MSNIIFNLKFTTKSFANKNDLKFSKKIDYISREEAIKNNSKFFINKRDRDNQKKNNYKKFFPEDEGYISREEAFKNRENIFNEVEEENKILYFCSEQGIVKEKDIKERMNNIKIVNKVQNKNKACLYSSAISFTNEFSEKNLQKKYTEEEMYEKLNPIIKNYLIQNNFDIDNTIFFLNAHTNEEYFHFHLEFLEKEPTRTKNKLKEKNLEGIKKNLYFSFDEKFQEEYKFNNLQLGKLKTEIRSFANVDNKDFFNSIDLSKATELFNKRRVRYYKDIKDNNLKKAINNARKKLVKEPEFKKILKDVKSVNKKLEDMNYEMYGNSNRNQTLNQNEEIDLMLNNYILKMIKLEEKPNLSNRAKYKLKGNEMIKVKGLLEKVKREKESMVEEMNYQLQQNER